MFVQIELDERFGLPFEMGSILNIFQCMKHDDPFWVQKPKLWNCSCGANTEFVCSMPSNLQYPCTADSPRQPSGRANSHFLFLGLSTYVFACRARCHPRAVVAVRQN
jgi:hypothetical protein